MPLHPAFPSPERILAFGPAGSSKTTSWLDIARWAQRTKSTAQFYVLDTDFAVDRMLTTYADCRERIHVYTGYDWSDYTAFLKVAAAATSEDWVVVDFMGSAWQAVQQFYVEQVFHKDVGDYFLQARKELSKNASSLGALDGWTDWSVVNGLYRQWVNPLLFKGRYNLFATAKSDSLSSDKKPTEDSQTRQLLAAFQVKPSGQKDLIFQFHTVLLTGRAITGNNEKYTMTTIKDREREKMIGQEMKSFTNDYLTRVGGWSLV